jgi:hypothetical protein
MDSNVSFRNESRTTDSSVIKKRFRSKRSDKNRPINIRKSGKITRIWFSALRYKTRELRVMP